MLKRKILVCLLCMCTAAFAQTKEMGRLRAAVAEHPQEDTIRVNRLNALGLEARKSLTKDSYRAYQDALRISRAIHYKPGEALALLGLGFHFRFNDETREGLRYTLEALNIFKSLKDTVNEIACYYNLVVIHTRVADFSAALGNGLKGLQQAELINHHKWVPLMNFQVGNVLQAIGDRDRAMGYYRKSLIIAREFNDKEAISHALTGIGLVHETLHNWDSAKICYEQNRKFALETQDPRGVCQADIDIANMLAKAGRYKESFSLVHATIPRLMELGQVGYLPFAHSILADVHVHNGSADSALYYAFSVIHASLRSGRIFSRGDMSKLIAEAYARKGDYKNAFHYQQLFTSYYDSLNLTDAIKRSTAQQYSLDMEKQQSQISLLTKNQELREQESRQQKILLAVTLTGLLLVIAFSVVLLRNNRLRHRAYRDLERQQAELKATQEQLIHSEKMASLGELTAGVAHEIQNPLNFVNNFSELNIELIEEFKSQKSKVKNQKNDNSEPGDAGDELLADIEANLQKISHHGKRADAIVKGMLQHSRSSTGQKELTDINSLCDEYLRLAYHGLRARDKSFNAKLETNFDANLPLVNIVAQDMGRVILNIINNALYAVHRKKSAGGSGYEPVVSVTTSLVAGKLRIAVKDNGTGIPAQVQSKIFQPFFTTKPAGEGTGLGLSLSYDIVTKGHNGSLEVSSVEGEGTLFIVEIPAR